MGISQSSIDIIFGRAIYHLKPYESCFKLSGKTTPAEISVALTACNYILTAFSPSDTAVDTAILYIRVCEEKYLKWLKRGAISFYPFEGLHFGGDSIITTRLELSICLN